MILSPGLWVVGAVVTVLFYADADIGAWFILIPALFVSYLIDRWLRIEPVEVPDIPTKTRYVRKK